MIVRNAFRMGVQVVHSLILQLDSNHCVFYVFLSKLELMTNPRLNKMQNYLLCSWKIIVTCRIRENINQFAKFIIIH